MRPGDGLVASNIKINTMIIRIMMIMVILMIIGNVDVDGRPCGAGKPSCLGLERCLLNECTCPFNGVDAAGYLSSSLQGGRPGVNVTASGWSRYHDCSRWPVDVNPLAVALFQAHGLLLYVPVLIATLIAFRRLYQMRKLSTNIQTFAVTLLSIFSLLYIIHYSMDPWHARREYTEYFFLSYSPDVILIACYNATLIFLRDLVSSHRTNGTYVRRSSSRRSAAAILASLAFLLGVLYGLVFTDQLQAYYAFYIPYLLLSVCYTSYLGYRVTQALTARHHRYLEHAQGNNNTNANNNNNNGNIASVNRGSNGPWSSNMSNGAAQHGNNPVSPPGRMFSMSSSSGDRSPDDPPQRSQQAPQRPVIGGIDGAHYAVHNSMLIRVTPVNDVLAVDPVVAADIDDALTQLRRRIIRFTVGSATCCTIWMMILIAGFLSSIYFEAEIITTSVVYAVFRQVEHVWCCLVLSTFMPSAATTLRDRRVAPESLYGDGHADGTNASTAAGSSGISLHIRGGGGGGPLRQGTFNGRGGNISSVGRPSVQSNVTNNGDATGVSSCHGARVTSLASTPSHAGLAAAVAAGVDDVTASGTNQFNMTMMNHSNRSSGSYGPSARVSVFVTPVVTPTAAASVAAATANNMIASSSPKVITSSPPATAHGRRHSLTLTLPSPQQAALLMGAQHYHQLQHNISSNTNNNDNNSNAQRLTPSPCVELLAPPLVPPSREGPVSPSAPFSNTQTRAPPFMKAPDGDRDDATSSTPPTSGINGHRHLSIPSGTIPLTIEASLLSPVGMVKMAASPSAPVHPSSGGPLSFTVAASATFASSIGSPVPRLPPPPSFQPRLPSRRTSPTNTARLPPLASPSSSSATIDTNTLRPPSPHNNTSSDNMVRAWSPIAPLPATLLSRHSAVADNATADINQGSHQPDDTEPTS